MRAAKTATAWALELASNLGEVKVDKMDGQSAERMGLWLGAAWAKAPEANSVGALG